MPKTSKLVVSLAEQLEHRAARVLVRTATRVAPYLPAQLAHVADGNRLDPGVHLLLKLQELVSPFGATRDPERARAAARRDARVHSGKPVLAGSVRDLTLDTPVPLRARHYAPREPHGHQPLVVYFHGGGFVVGDLDTHDLPCRLLCKHAGVHVLAIDYRLAPEHPFPAAVDDALAAFQWGLSHAQQLGADPARVAVAGDSAGANLATVVSQLRAQQGQPKPAAQLLIYPTLDRTENRPSLTRFATGYFLTRESIDWFTAQYVPNPDQLTDPRVSPLLATDLRNQSPAVVVTAGFDPLRDEGNEYARKLEMAGNRVQLVAHTDLVHGFINMGALSPHARRCFVQLAHTLREWVG